MDVKTPLKMKMMITTIAWIQKTTAQLDLWGGIPPTQALIWMKTVVRTVRLRMTIRTETGLSISMTSVLREHHHGLPDHLQILMLMAVKTVVRIWMMITITSLTRQTSVQPEKCRGHLHPSQIMMLMVVEIQRKMKTMTMMA